MRLLSGLLIVLMLASFGSEAQSSSSVGGTQPRQPLNHAAVSPDPGQNRSHSLVMRISPLMDLYYLIRMHAAAKTEKPPKIDGFEAAVRASREAQDAFGGPIEAPWGLLDITLSRCENAAQAIEAFSRLPVTIRGGAVPLREKAVQLAKAMNAIEASFMKDIWPRHKMNLEKSLARINKAFASQEAACISFIAKSLDFNASPVQLSFYLVAQAPALDSVTYFLRGGDQISVVAAPPEAGLWNDVVILYEGAHVLRYKTTKGNAVTDLSERLQKAGVADEQTQDTINTLLFAQAAETVRRILDPSHKSLPKNATVEARFPLMSSVVRPAWTKYLDGQLSREAALNQIVDGLPKPNRKG